MMFSTKAEYGVRVMVELARRGGADPSEQCGPVPLAEIAEHDGLPLAYLEHLVARLRKAGLVDSRRGSRGGYLLARAADQITMAEVVEALEGAIAPIECISQAADGSLVCAREADPEHICVTKVLWTRVRGSIVRTLQETTLADLLATAGRASAKVAVAKADVIAASAKVATAKADGAAASATSGAATPPGGKRAAAPAPATA